MANYYIDHGAYSAQGVIGAANPTTWAVPQEGDGSGLTAASASGVASILFNAIPTSGNFVICGITFTSPAGVLNAASVDAAANALAGLINASTTAVGATVATGVPALKNLVFARGPSGGAPAGTCQIMMRIGSAALNHSSNTNVAISHTFDGTAPTLTQFAGGSGGCWGWFVNDVTVGGSSATFAASNFGILSPTKPFMSCANGAATVLAEPASNDTIWGRSGAGQTITMPVNSSIVNSSAMHTNFVLDTNTQWIGDSGIGQVTISMALSNLNIQITVATSLTHFKSCGCIKPNALRFYLRSTATGGHCSVAASAAANRPSGRCWNLLFEENTANLTNCTIHVGASNYTHMHLQNCTFDIRVPRTTGWGNGAFAPLGTYGGTLRLDGCVVLTNFTGVTQPGPVVTSSSISQAASSIHLHGCHFNDANGKTFIPFAASAGANNCTFVADACSGLKIDSGSYVGCPTGVNSGYDIFSGKMVYSSQEVGLTFRDENRLGVCDWIYGANYPVLRAAQPDGTLWSVKMDWLTTSGIASESNPFRSIPFSQVYREAAATKTITLEALVPNAVTLDSIAAVMKVQYISNATGAVVVEHMKGVAAAYAASAASWTLNGLANYSAKKFILTTAQAIKQNTMITVYLEFHRPAPTANRQIYVDPEFALT